MPSDAERRVARRTASLAAGLAAGLAGGLAGGLALPRAAAAQPTSRAQELFDQGRQVLSSGEVAAACAKFEESERLEPAGGTLMNLAACHEREGRTARAWAEFNDALAWATRDGRDDRVEEARRQISRLEPHLARVIVVVDAPAPESLEIRLDGLALGAAALRSALPVDPGEHELSASAQGHLPWSERISAASDNTLRVVVPHLTQRAPVAPASPPAAWRETSLSATNRPPVAAYLLGSFGLLAIGTGSGFGIFAATKKSASNADCTMAGCTSTGASLMHDANTAAWVSDVAFGAGILSSAVAGYLLLSPPTQQARTSASIAPALGPNSLGIAGSGSW